MEEYMFQYLYENRLWRIYKNFRSPLEAMQWFDEKYKNVLFILMVKVSNHFDQPKT